MGNEQPKGHTGGGCGKVNVKHEVSSNIPETDLGGLMESGLQDTHCTKNPGHPTFIPVQDFSLHHVFKSAEENMTTSGLSANVSTNVSSGVSSGVVSDSGPTGVSPNSGVSVKDQVSEYLETCGLCAQDIVDVVKAYAPTTVRIQGGCISQDRATQWFGVDGAYPFCEYRGENVRNHGSGWVKGVSKITDHVSGSEYWEIYINTARHVIFDGVEAAKCSITLFDVGEPQLTPVTLSGGRFDRGDTEDDWCRMGLTTEDESLVQKLVSLCERRYTVVRKVVEKMKAHRESKMSKMWQRMKKAFSQGDNYEENSPVLLLTYPHGKQCHATLGRLRKVEEKGVVGLYTSVSYSTDSCAGSSGGLVVPVGRLGDGAKLMMTHPHGGADPESGLNLSAGKQLFG